MRALSGPVMLVVMVGGYLIYHFASKEPAPPKSFTKLEFAGADVDHTGSCYSFDTVLFANRAFGKATRTWTSPRDDAWTLSLDDVVQGNGGPQSVFTRFTFEKQGDQIRLVSMEASEGISTDLKINIDNLIGDPIALYSKIIERCEVEGAKGYMFVPPKKR